MISVPVSGVAKEYGWYNDSFSFKFLFLLLSGLLALGNVDDQFFAKVCGQLNFFIVFRLSCWWLCKGED